MKFLKILLYLLAIPVFVYFELFLQNLSWFSLILIFTIVAFRDLKQFHLLWLLIVVALLLDVSTQVWLGTYLISSTIVLLTLLLFDRLVSNVFLDIIVVFFTFVIFRIFFSSFIFLQETSVLPFFTLEFFTTAFVFALKNIFIYLLLKLAQYFLKSYFRGNIL
jgi:hypothetical protein